jgi:hypothetical protein
VDAPPATLATLELTVAARLWMQSQEDTTMKRSVIVASAIVLAISLVSPAIAGERTGNGGFNPIGTHVIVAAICSFSGLEDFNGGPVVPGDTQTPHESGGTIEDPGVASICQLLNPGKLFK